MENELEGKIESEMPREDADQTPKTDIQSAGSFVTDPKKVEKQEKRTVTVLDVLLYVGKQLKDIKEQNVVLTELLRTFFKQQAQDKLKSEAISTLEATAYASPVQPTTQIGQVDEGMDRVRKALSEFIVDNSIVINSTDEDKGNTMYYIIRSTKFLGSEKFASIANIVRGLGGEYVSQGKASHFKVPKSGK